MGGGAEVSRLASVSEFLVGIRYRNLKKTFYVYLVQSLIYVVTAKIC